VSFQLSDEAYLLKSREEARERPPLSSMRIAEEVLGGTLAGTLGGVAALAAAMAIDAPRDTFLIVSTGAWAIGSGGAVYLFGNMGDQTGSFSATMLGSAAGVGIVVAFSWVSAYLGNDLYDTNPDLWVVAALVSILLPPTGATIGFNLTRRYDDSSTAEPETGPVNAKDMQMSFAVRGAYSRPDPLRVDLLRGRF
jgi:hypothetical protein